MVIDKEISVHGRAELDGPTDRFQEVCVAMERRPEEERALRYLRRRGTEATPDEVRDRVRRAFAALEGALDELDAGVVRRRPAPGKWCVQEIVDHLIASHRPGIDELGQLIAGRRPEGGPIPAGLLSADAMERDWTELVAELRDVQARFLATLETATDATLLAAKAPIVMVVKVAEPDGTLHPSEWIEDLDWKAYAVALAAHTREHQSQIERAAAGAGSSAPALLRFRPGD